MLIEYGNTVVKKTWELNEESPTGYSRIYYVLEGEVTYEASDGRQALMPGHLYVLPSTIPYHVWRNPEIAFACTYLHVDFSKYRVSSLIELPVEEGSCLERFIATVAAAIREERIELLEQLAEAFSAFLKNLPITLSITLATTTIMKTFKAKMSGSPARMPNIL